MNNQLDQYKALFSDLIKKQMIVLGPAVALATARKVSGLVIADDGTVTGITGDMGEATRQLTQVYLDLSGAIAQTMIEGVLTKYPALK